MGVAQYAEISAALIAAGHDPATPAAIVESGTTEKQRVIRTSLAQPRPRRRPRSTMRPPALLLVGETARFAERYSWFAPSRIEVSKTRRRSHARASVYSSTIKKPNNQKGTA